ncbi:MAG: DNA-binding transcriptional MerR regulator [Alphaproteobacteria bacterium]|jgi:DNA-binding transcriptional MerR regulator
MVDNLNLFGETLAPEKKAEAKKKRVKSDSAYRTISEVADVLGVATHVLRFWETKFPQIQPVKRGGGRRYYRPEDIQVLEQIQELLHDKGYTIRGVKALFKEKGAVDAAVGSEATQYNSEQSNNGLTIPRAFIDELKIIRRLLD